MSSTNLRCFARGLFTLLLALSYISIDARGGSGGGHGGHGSYHGGGRGYGGRGYYGRGGYYGGYGYGGYWGGPMYPYWGAYAPWPYAYGWGPSFGISFSSTSSSSSRNDKQPRMNNYRVFNDTKYAIRVATNEEQKNIAPGNTESVLFSSKTRLTITSSHNGQRINIYPETNDIDVFEQNGHLMVDDK